MVGIGNATWASAQTLTPLASFSGSDGAEPNAGLIADANGNLFGTTYYGGTSSNCGTSGCGTVFEIKADSTTVTGYASAPITLVSFSGSDGENPSASLIADANGNLFGTTFYGGTLGHGSVFEIVCTSFSTVCTSYASAPTTLISFNLSDGGLPVAGLIADANGNLFGTTEIGGANGEGTVFELACNSFSTVCSGYASAPTTLVSFNVSDGAYPDAHLIADASGNLFGTASRGGTSSNCGTNGCGTVFELACNSFSTICSSYAGAPTTLVSFSGSDGATPYAGLIADANGNLFGTTETGGTYGQGTVFEVKADTTSATGYAGAPTTLVSFSGSDGAHPDGGLIADVDGNLFGTTLFGGASASCASGCGTVFELACNSFSTVCSSYASSPTTLVSFCALSNCADGEWLFAGLIADARSGNLFGTTFYGGTHNKGTVFEIADSGFVPLQFAGTPGAPSCVGHSVSVLARTYGGIAHAAAGLGYASVKDLQAAIGAYCGG